jgi:2'-5' RNA ligase
LIVPFVEAEAVVEPWMERYLPVWKLGVPAHVTLLFPFPTHAELDAAALADLTTLFASTPAITAHFAEVGQFPDVVYLAPEPRDWFVGLTRALSQRFGLLPYGGQHAEVVPHLSVARHTDPAVQAEIAGALRPLLPIESPVREVWLMDEEQDGHWHRSATFPLGPTR